ncbi:hypothetical protein SynPROS91_00760 [Synechococcus sp. PROS-9-1]|nr:hypothetical protein SynPROS91_00760 [Synechococcus sp. PROS-9-1]
MCAVADSVLGFGFRPVELLADVIGKISHEKSSSIFKESALPSRT